MARILVIEDNYEIAKKVCEYLESQQHEVDYAAD